MMALRNLLFVVLVTALVVQQGDAGWFRIRIRWRKVVRVVSYLQPLHL